MTEFRPEAARIAPSRTTDISIAAGSRLVSTEVLSGSVIKDNLPGVEGVAREAIPVLDGRATLVVGAEVPGLWHYSANGIEKFSREKAEASRGGKFGSGTYFGIGDLTGETVDELKNDGSIKHEIGFTGNILVTDRHQTLGLSQDLGVAQGLPRSRVRITTQTAPLTDRVQGITFEGYTVDAVVIYMDQERETAECIVLPEATDNIEILA